MHKREIARLNSRVKQDGFALIPLSLYFKNSLVKVELGLCKGKKLHDKRETEAKKDAAREIERSIKDR
jgi:SsrA-binding protein